MWQGLIKGVIGIWLIVSGILGAALHDQWNYVLAGAVMAVFGFRTRKVWQSLVTGILGLWLMVSAFIGTMRPANMILVGIVVAGLCLWENIPLKPKAKTA